MKSTRFSVIVPTYQRRDLVVSCVSALAKQKFSGEFEVIVVVDGSSDGSADALRGLKLPIPLTVIEQPNSGRSMACNRGAAIARGEIVMFLDDDMEAHPRLLAEHDMSRREGADAVMGNLPLHPDSPDNLLSRGCRYWAEDRNRRLSAPGAKLMLLDMITGQMSVRREVFLSLGGFDTNFTLGGTFGNEDLDFCYRLKKLGYRIVYNPEAISWQKYVVTPKQYFRQSRQVGGADVAFVRKHPDQMETIFPHREPLTRWVWRPLSTLPWFGAPTTAALSRFVVRQIENGRKGRGTFLMFYGVNLLRYWQGVHEAGGIPRPRPVLVLAYHAIADLEEQGQFKPYCIRPDTFRRQIDTLLEAGYHFVGVDEFLRYQKGFGGVPRRALLLTFDDCYENLLTAGLPILRERGIPAIAFAVTGYLGGTNEWDRAIGAPRLRLVDADGLRELSKNNVEIGAHSRTHRTLCNLDADELSQEVAGSVSDLEAAGLPRPRLYSYPYGEYDERVRQAVKDSGLQAAFTVDSGYAHAKEDPFKIPRTEIFPEDNGVRWSLRLSLWAVKSLIVATLS